MQRFLEKTSRYICTQHQHNLADICVVLPNRRAGLFLKKIIPGIVEKTTWAPDIFSIEDFIIHLSGFSLADQIDLLFTLHQIHQDIEKEDTHSFEDFLSWGQLILSDFNDIDLHLADAKSLFTYLSEAKAIERWNPSSATLSESVKKYLRFYQSLIHYYTSLHGRCIANKSGYQGLIFKRVSGLIEQIIPNLKWQKVYFAGFNALTPSEQKIITALVESKKAEILWDADDYYVSNSMQEAGYFLRKEIEKNELKKFKWVDEGFRKIIKEVNLIGVPNNLGQARYAASVIGNWANANTATADTLSNAALVLTDENLLFPVLNSLHDNTPKFNVTMGLPIKLTVVFQLFNHIIRAFENADRFQSLNQNKAKGFYYSDIIVILQHPILFDLKGTNNSLNKIKKAKRAFYQPDEITPLFDNYQQEIKEILLTIFGHLTPTVSQLIENMIFIIGKLRKIINENVNEQSEAANPEIEYLFHLSGIFTRLQGLLAKHQICITLKAFKYLFNQIIQSNRVPFEGEPLTGLQIMGLLETRTLDFEKVIILSVNEGIIPPTSTLNSIIPLDIRQTFGLPGIMETNAVSAYHFYRLLQRAKEIHLVYNTEPDDLGGGEASRFIMQLEHELKQYQPAHIISKKIIHQPIPDITFDNIIVIEKEEAVYRKLLDKAKQGLSPTSLNSFIECGLKFYFSDIAGIKEEDEMEEFIESKTIGSIIHRTLELLYKPYINKALRADDINEMKQAAQQDIATAFADKYPGGEFTYGWNRLIKEVIHNFVEAFLKNEQKFLSAQKQLNRHLTILKLEHPLNAIIHLDITGDADIKIKGIIDRVDQIEGKLRIIDYKTGKVEKNDLTFDTWESFAISENKSKAIQVLIYSWLYEKNYSQQEFPFISGIFALQKPSIGLLSFAIKQEINENQQYLVDKTTLRKFEEILKEILTNLFDKSIPFTQTTNLNICQYCDFKKICQRLKLS